MYLQKIQCGGFCCGGLHSFTALDIIWEDVVTWFSLRGYECFGEEFRLGEFWGMGVAWHLGVRPDIIRRDWEEFYRVQEWEFREWDIRRYIDKLRALFGMSLREYLIRKLFRFSPHSEEHRWSSVQWVSRKRSVAIYQTGDSRQRQLIFLYEMR